MGIGAVSEERQLEGFCYRDVVETRVLNLKERRESRCHQPAWLAYLLLCQTWLVGA